MSIIYTCRHCQQTIGTLEQQVVSYKELGFDQLPIEDQKKMITYLENGDIQIKSICEACESSLRNHPTYHELDYFIQ